MPPQNFERMSNTSYRLMVATMNFVDFLFSHTEKRVSKFGILPGSTVVDYGCGPGRFTVFYSRLAGPLGKVYAVDVHPIAIELVNRKKDTYGLTNVEARLADGYASGLPDGVADLVTALDIFFGIHDQKAFLAELRRIAKPNGILVIDDGHQPRRATRAQIAAAGGWSIVEETRDHMKCKPA
jgi:ubiquinone/menaquinone biosynthesis C-methylase UbiE